MENFINSNEFYSAILQILGGIIAVWIAASLTLSTLKNTEMGRLRIKCVVELISYRWVLKCSSEKNKNGEAYISFISALNAVPVLFGSDNQAMKFLRNFSSQTGEDKDKALIDLLQYLLSITKIPSIFVKNDDLMMILS